MRFVGQGLRAAVALTGGLLVGLAGPSVGEPEAVPDLVAAINAERDREGAEPLLASIHTPCAVVGGRVEEMQPSAGTESIADALPNGTYLLLDHQTHFGPFSHPDEIAALVP